MSHPFHAHPDAPAISAPPFIVEHVLPAMDAPGNFVPAARLLVTSALRTSGLLAQLPDAEAKSLLLLLTFLSPNGRLRASVNEVTEALRTSPDKARRRIRRLAETRWQGAPLAAVHATETGLELYALSSRLVEERDVPLPPAPVPVYQAAGREAVIAHSRSRYAVPRVEAERAVAEQYGHTLEEVGEGDEAVARQQLAALGVPRDQVGALFEEHPLEQIQEQIKWLPLRNAKSPARFIVAAIQNRYLPPPQARSRPAPPIDSVHAEENEEAGLPRSGDLAMDGRTLEVPPREAGEGDRA